MPPFMRRRRKKGSPPSRLSDLVSSHTRRWKLTALHRLEVIRRKWAQAAGEYVAGHTVPVRLVRKTLRVAVPDSGWASEMTYLAGPILERLQALLRGNWVEEIKPVLVDSIPDSPAPAPGVKLPEPTEKMLADAQRAVAGISDDDLREAMRRAVLASLRRLDAEASHAVNQGQEKPRNGERS
jgi:hypothetical protein